MPTQKNPYSASERLQILSPDEYEQVWGIPRFTADNRSVFFAVGPREMALIQRLRTPRTKAHLLLLIGYFRSRQRIFSLNTPACVEPIDGRVDARAYTLTPPTEPTERIC